MMGQRWCGIVFVLACVTLGAGSGRVGAQELVAQPHCDLVLVDLQSLRDDITVRALALADAPYLYKGWTQTQKVELSAWDQFAMLRIWDRALTEEARVESETWQLELMPTAATALVIRSQGGSGTYDLDGVPLRDLSVFGQGTKFRFNFLRPNAQVLDLAWASVFDGELDLGRFLNARPQHVVLRASGTKVRLDLGGEPFAGEAEIVVAGSVGSLDVVVRRDVGLQVKAPPTVLRAFASDQLSAISGGLQSRDFDAAACRVRLVVEDAIAGMHVTWEGTAEAAATAPRATESLPAASMPTTDKEFEEQIAAFLVLAARRDYPAAVERLRMLQDLRPGDARLLFLETWLHAHPNLQFDVVPILGEAERYFREGLDYYVAGQREEALLRFREAAKADPKLETAALWARKTAEEIEAANPSHGVATAATPSSTESRPAGAAEPPPRIVVQSAAPLFAMQTPITKRVATRADRIEFSGRVADDVGIDRIDITLNGAAFRDRAGEPIAIRPRSTDPDSSRELRFAFAVPLRPGPNEIVLTAFDIDATAHRTRESFTVVRLPSFFRTGTFAIILGGIVILGTAVLLVLRVVRPRGGA